MKLLELASFSYDGMTITGDEDIVQCFIHEFERRGEAEQQLLQQNNTQGTTIAGYMADAETDKELASNQARFAQRQEIKIGELERIIREHKENATFALKLENIIKQLEHDIDKLKQANAFNIQNAQTAYAEIKVLKEKLLTIKGTC